MGTSRGPRADRASLQVEHLEDRTTPSLAPPTLAPGVPVIQVGSTTFAADRVTVLMNEGVSGSALGSAPFAQQVRSIGFDMYSVRLTPGTDLNTALAYFAAQPGVEAAEMDAFVHATRLPNDPSYGSLYGPGRIGAETVWDRTTGNPNFVVGVIDSGVDYTHPDLAANMWTNPGEVAGDRLDNDNNGYVDDIYGWDFANDDNDPMDEDGHGTHVAGTLGAVGNNGVGVTGVNWGVKIMALNFLGFGPNSGLISSEVAAIHYSVMMGVKVTNNSYGGATTSLAEARAIAQAEFAGQIYVTAAGNDGTNNDSLPNYPANFSQVRNNVITVAATDSNDALADFSNYGATSVTLGAPGVGILSTVPSALDSDGTVDGYDTYDGTSMASPQVAGALALYWSANPTLSYDQVVNVLKRSVDKISGLTGLVSTGGRLNVARMFNMSPVPPIVVNAPVGTEVVRMLGPGGTTQLALNPHPGFLGGIVAAAGDVTGDGVADMVTAATFGGHVKVFDGTTGTELRSFYGFEGYVGPINVGIGDLTNDGVGDIIVSAKFGGHVKVFDGVTGELTFSAYVYQGYLGSVAVSVADTTGDGRSELITAADGGLGVHVMVFDAATLAARDSFFATGPGAWPEFSISAADLDLNGIADLLVSQGPRVRVLDMQTKAVRADFIAFNPLSMERLTVQASRYSGDASAELVAIRETQGLSHVMVFDGQDFTLADSFFAGTR